MFSLWHSFDDNPSESISDMSFFRAQNNLETLALKFVENLPEQPTGTSAFWHNTLEHLLASSDKKTSQES